jgi:hypothetical protein
MGPMVHFQEPRSAFNRYKPGTPQQTRIDKRMSNPRFSDAVAEIILPGQIDKLTAPVGLLEPK